MSSNPRGRTEIVPIIEKIGTNGARYIEEYIDPQFQALKYLYGHMGRKERFVPLVVANALVSYQLSGRGEEWWWEFARWFSEHESREFVSDYAEFLPKSKANRRLVPAKLKRLERVEDILRTMNPETYYEDMAALRDDLARTLGRKKNAKTIVFAVKMFGYAMRIATGKFIPYPMEIPIPVDSRIRKLTERLGEEDPIAFWQEVAEETRVPPLHIDSILWPTMSGDPEVQEKIRRAFGKIGKDLVEMLGKYYDKVNHTMNSFILRTRK